MVYLVWEQKVSDPYLKSPRLIGCWGERAMADAQADLRAMERAQGSGRITRDMTGDLWEAKAKGNVWVVTIDAVPFGAVEAQCG